MKVKSLAEQLFFTTVRIDTVSQSGVAYSGTAFLFAHRTGEQVFRFVVSNKHVVMDMKEGALTFLQREGTEPRIGQGFRLNLEDWSDAWHGHPVQEVDIAVCPFGPMADYIEQQRGVDLFYRFVATEMIPSQEQIENIDALESVTFVGYPNGVWDRVNLLPVGRRGTTASLLGADFEAKPCFLIDASVFGGSSGSPVFILNQGLYSGRDGNSTFGSRLMFLGVLAAGFYRTEKNQLVMAPLPTQLALLSEQHEMIDLGVVFKARCVVEAIEAVLKNKGSVTG